MFDTRAQPNILKKGCIKPNININRNDILSVTGITEDTVNTLGSLRARVVDVLVVFHIVSNNFSIIPQDVLRSIFHRA